MEFTTYSETSKITNSLLSDSPYILLLERAESTIGAVDDCVFEGTAAVLDVMNDNRRIYTKEEYLSHLPYLQEKIKRGRLFGEIDHPQGYYDVRLKNISHRIEALWYDDATNCIKIRIRLLRGTPGGDFALNLVKLGIPLAISSRAVGKVVNNVPQILRIFTFDLVAEPGFRDSILHPTSEIMANDLLRENLQYLTESLNSFQENSCLNQCEILNENQNFGEYIQIYKINNEKVIEELNEIFENNSSIIENNLINMDQKEFAAYTDKTAKELNSLKSIIGKLNEDLQEVQSQFQNAQQQPQIQPTAQMQTQQTQQELQAQVTELPNITEDDTSEEAMDKLKIYVDFMSNEITKLGQNQIQLQESLNSQNAIIHTIGKAVNRAINHENLLIKKLNETLNFLDMEIVPTLNEAANTTNIQSYLITKLIEMGDHLSDKTNDALNYSNFLGSVSEAHAGFMNMIASNEGLGKGIKGNEIVNMNESVDGGNISHTKPEVKPVVTKVKVASINESANAVIAPAKQPTSATVKDNSPKAIFENLQAAAEKVLQRVDENSTISVLKKQYPFLNLLESANQQRFFNLETNVKKEVIDALNKGVYFNQNDVMAIMESVVASQGSDLEDYLRFIPNEFKPIYENLNESKRKEIEMMANSGMYRLDSPYNIKSFWHSLGLNENLSRIQQKELQEKKNIDTIQSLNENKQEDIVVGKNFAYDSDYIKSILNR